MIMRQRQLAVLIRGKIVDMTYSWLALIRSSSYQESSSELEKDSNYSESFARLSKLWGTIALFELQKDSNNGGLNLNELTACLTIRKCDIHFESNTIIRYLL